MGLSQRVLVVFNPSLSSSSNPTGPEHLVSGQGCLCHSTREPGSGNPITLAVLPEGSANPAIHFSTSHLAFLSPPLSFRSPYYSNYRKVKATSLRPLRNHHVATDAGQNTSLGGRPDRECGPKTQEFRGMD